MPIVAKNDKVKAPQVPDGQHIAVCCDVQDLGILEVTFGNNTKKQRKVVVWFQFGQVDDDGNRYLIGQRFTLSMHEKANLRIFLEAWRGKPYTEDQAREGVDVENMIGVPALLQTALNDRDYANITAIMRLPKDMPAIEVSNYVRAQDRDHASVQAEQQEQDDDLPF